MRTIVLSFALHTLWSLAQGPTEPITEVLRTPAEAVQTPVEAPKVKWVTITEAQEAAKKDPKPILMDV